MNEILLNGKITNVKSPFIMKNGYYCTECTIGVERLSGYVDEIKLLVKDNVCPYEDLIKFADDMIEVRGEICTRNLTDKKENKRHLEQFVNVKKIEPGEDLCFNNVNIDGIIVKKPVKRYTPFGKRIFDAIVVYNTPKGKSYYIPVMGFGKIADGICELDVGTKIHICGRYQSRKYIKVVNNKPEERKVLELCVNNYNLLENENEK